MTPLPSIRPFRLLVAAAVAAAALTYPVAADAHTISIAKATRVAERAVIQGTGASKATADCHRKTAHKAVCHVVGHYDDGARRCGVDITVSFASRTSTRMRWTAGATRCS